MGENEQPEPERVVDGWKRKTIATLGMVVPPPGPIPEDERDPDRDGRYTASRHKDREKKAEEVLAEESPGVSSP